MFQNSGAMDAGICGAICHRASVELSSNGSTSRTLLQLATFGGAVKVSHSGSHTTGAADHWPTLHCTSATYTAQQQTATAPNLTNTAS